MWFELKGDARLGRCASEGCGGQPIWRLEADGIGSNYCSGCKAPHVRLPSGGGPVNRTPKTFLEFDDAGASDDEPARGVTAGDIRAWHDQYERLLSSWAECRDFLS